MIAWYVNEVDGKRGKLSFTFYIFNLPPHETRKQKKPAQ